MVEFRIKIHPEQRLAYIPKEIAETLGSKVTAIGNCVAVVFYPENVSLEDVVRSLEIIQKDLEHAIKLKQKGRLRRNE